MTKLTSKFDLATYARDGDTLDSSFIRMLIDCPSRVYVEVPQSCQYRIDLLAKHFFGNSKLYWIFEIMNSIMSMEELAAGKLLQAVTMADFERLYTQWRHSSGQR